MQVIAEGLDGLVQLDLPNVYYICLESKLLKKKIFYRDLKEYNSKFINLNKNKDNIYW